MSQAMQSTASVTKAPSEASMNGGLPSFFAPTPAGTCRSAAMAATIADMKPTTVTLLVGKEWLTTSPLT